MAEFTVLAMPATPTASVAKVHPVVLFNICDSYIRRNDPPEATKGPREPRGPAQDRVIGTLLGSISADGAVEIKNSYAVPHNESMDQVAVDIDYHRTMFELNQRVNPKEVIVGWYSTGAGVSLSDALIQDFYSREVPNPIHLTVDTALVEEKVAVKAYVSTTVSLGERQLAAQFHEIHVDVRMAEAERVGTTVLSKTSVDKLPDDLEGLGDTMEHLESMIDTAYRYVDDVVEGRTAPDSSIGRYLGETVAALPKLGPDAFNKLFNDSVQDLLLVLYLASLTRTQLAVAAKLNTAAQQI